MQEGRARRQRRARVVRSGDDQDGEPAGPYLAYRHLAATAQRQLAPHSIAGRSAPTFRCHAACRPSTPTPPLPAQHVPACCSSAHLRQPAPATPRRQLRKRSPAQPCGLSARTTTVGQGASGAMCGIRSDRCRVKRVPQTPTSPAWQQGASPPSAVRWNLVKSSPSAR